MKKLLVITICLMAAGTSFAQNNTAPKKKLTPAEQYAAAHKVAVGGYIRDARNVPIEGVRAFVYKTDSSAEIISSGFSDATGHYETNFTNPGKYTLKLIYPSNKMVTVTGVVVKKGITNISMKANEPEADTTLPYTDFIPKPAENKKAKKK